MPAWLQHPVTFSYAPEITRQAHALTISIRKSPECDADETSLVGFDSEDNDMKARKRLLAIAALGLGAAYLAPVMVVAEEDFSRYTNEELVQKRAQVGEMSAEERDRFRAEMRQRARAMTPEERASLGIGNARRGAAGEDGEVRRQGPQGEQGERGAGELQRERQRVHSADGYGQGYGQREPRQSRVEQGADRSQGEAVRERQRLGDGERGYGRGYEARGRDGAGAGRSAGGRRGD
jgi:hypothetical protein